MAEHLGIHVIVRGFGESIVVEMPNQQFGVVDCFSQTLKLAADTSVERRRVNPIVRFLTEGLNAPRLAIVAWTHPHEDHSRGLSHLLAEYRGRIDLLWVYESWQELFLERYFLARKERGRLPIEDLLGDLPGTFARELLRIRELLCEQLFDLQPNARLETFAGRRSYNVGAASVVWHALSPSQSAAARYKRDLIDNLTDFVDDDGRIVNRDWAPESIDHNRISGGFLLEFGQTRILLGGDIVQHGWQEFLDSRTHEPLEIGCQLVKASHHGSETGYVPELYPMFARDRPPLVVLTPFNRHAHPLPRHGGVQHLRQHAASVRATCRSAAARALEVSEPAPIRLPAQWISRLTQQPELATLLRPDYATTPVDVSAAQTVPAEWLSGIERNPQLGNVLRQSALLNTNDGRDENLYRVSYWFDNAGNVVNEYHGEETGLLE